WSRFGSGFLGPWRSLFQPLLDDGYLLGLQLGTGRHLQVAGLFYGLQNEARSAVASGHQSVAAVEREAAGAVALVVTSLAVLFQDGSRVGLCTQWNSGEEENC